MRWITTTSQSRAAKESHSQRMLVQKSMSKLSKRKKQRKPAKPKLRKLKALNWQEAVSLFEKHDHEARAWIQNRYTEYVRVRNTSCDPRALLKTMEEYKQEVELGSMNAAAEEYELAMAAQEIIGGN